MYVEILYAIEHTLFVRLKYHRRFYFPYFCMIYIALYQNSCCIRIPCCCVFVLLHLCVLSGFLKPKPTKCDDELKEVEGH